MELRQLRYFDAVARLGGFTRAAQALRVAQPAVSAQIRQLEAELGVALLVRTTRRVHLTRAGELFLARTRRVLDELEGARSEIHDLAGVARGRVAIGVTEVLGSLELPDALAAFHARHPGVTLVMRTGLIAQLLAALDAGDVDLVIGPIHDDLPARYAARPLVDEHIVLITALAHPLARQSHVALGDLRDEPFVCLPPGSGLRSILENATRSAGFEARVQFETSSPVDIRQLVSAGLGIALIAGSVARAPGPPITRHIVDPAREHPSIGMIHYQDRRLSPVAQAWVSHLTHWDR